MTAKLPSLKTLQAFDAAARHLSFTKAAEELGVTQGAVSAQIAKLEAELRTELFVRTTRQVRLSDKGAALARACRRAFDGIGREIEIITERPAGNVLTIAVSTYVATRWLSRRLIDFLERHPDTTVRFQHSVNADDFEISDVDLAIRWGDGKWQGCKVELWLAMTKRPMCSPRLLRGAHALRSPGDLRHHCLLRDVPTVDLWDKWLRRAGLSRADVPQSTVLSDPVVRVQAAIDGQGVVLADDLAKDEITTGRLVEPFDIELDGYGYFLLRPTDSEDRAVVKHFRRWLLRQAARET
ncbi:MAG TPA: LysR substrate-binding domain-containing protein [Hyphomicrobiaceae bacterium]